MNNLVGGLFNTQEKANLAHEALQRSGFTEEQIKVYVPKPRNRTARSTDVSIQDIAKNAFLGALLLGAIGGFIGFLVGVGTISLPYLEPGSAPREPLFIFMSVLWGLITGGLTGAILGVASKLLRSKETAEVTTRQIEKGGVLLTVSVNDSQGATRVRRVMEENDATEVGNPDEKWDLDAWLSPNEVNPSLRNAANTR